MMTNFKDGGEELKVQNYPLLENDEFYTKWRIKMIRQIKLDGWERLIDDTFDSRFLHPRTDQDLYSLQAIFMSTVLEMVLLNIYGMKFARLYDDTPRVFLGETRGASD